MGAGPSKEELLYAAVQNSNHEAVRTLRRDGASFEDVDKGGRTPLILACIREDLYDMVITLLNQGAKLDTCTSGTHGGYPLHHAAKKGLDKTVLLLLSRGANPFAINDDGLTPLDMARNKSHVSVVRIIEDRICLFSGTVRELSGPGFVEAIAPQIVTKKVWVAVLPTEKDPRKIPKNELVIYRNSRVAKPRTVISLAKAEVVEPTFNQHDPVFVITDADKTAKVRYKFMAENEGDKAQLERFYKACAQGILQTESGPPALPALSPTQVPTQGLQALMRHPAPQSSPSTTPPNAGNPASQSKPTTPTSPAEQSGSLLQSELIPDEIALAMAINASKPTTPTSQAEQSGSRLQSELIPDAIALAMAINASKPTTPTSQAEQSGSRLQSELIPDEIALAMALNASIISAYREGLPVSPSAQHSSSWDGGRNNRGQTDEKNAEKREFGGLIEGEQRSCSGWGLGSSGGAGSSMLAPSVADSPSTSESSKSGAPKPAPSPTSGRTSSSSQSLTLIAPSSPPPAPSAPPPPSDGPIHHHFMEISLFVIFFFWLIYN